MAEEHDLGNGAGEGEGRLLPVGLGELRDRLEQANRSVVDFVRAHPAGCLLGALAFGFAVGRLASRRW